MRAQTTLDFAIGISIFLAVVLFTFGFIPTLLDPFDVTAQERPVQAERAADSLSQGMLGSPENPHVLDRYCTVEFFNTSGDGPDECRYNGTSIDERLGFGIATNSNVTLRQGGEILCWTDQGGTSFADDGINDPGITTDCDTSADTMLTAGDTTRSDLDTTLSSQRVVSVGGERATLEVVIW